MDLTTNIVQPILHNVNRWAEIVESRTAIRTDRLRRLREQHGWSQREMARLCDFGEGQIRKYELDESDPSSTHLKRIAELVDVSTDYLLGLTDDPHVQVREPALDLDERAVLEVYRREGWSGVARLSVERLSK